MRPPILSDTGPLFAAADKDDEHHVRAQREGHRLALEDRTVLILYPTLLEAHRLVLKKLGKAASVTWLADVTSSTLALNPTPEDYRVAQVRLMRYSDQPITLFDAVVAVVAERIRAEVWTYDHHFDVMRARVWR